MPQLDRLHDEKVAQIGELAAFRERLLTLRVPAGPGRAHGAFCGCLDGPAPPDDEHLTFEERSGVSGNEGTGPSEDCSCGKDGGSSNCAAGCGTSSANGTVETVINRQPADR
ncbi:hypothetical protein [Pseudonocardia kunmingensis]|uniref:Uncharacterized protein n=1 Tax=Pseudonocardia kunmingensis TaxID=630975 RepID=A0A543DP59_9PSEU|nr:hypothetical protein [Pseudonocardia kunmingensis]TQM11099.1 hypothetical protein FB558_3643 [Pseudonocardia kunmingensis]